MSAHGLPGQVFAENGVLQGVKSPCKITSLVANTCREGGGVEDRQRQEGQGVCQHRECKRSEHCQSDGAVEGLKGVFTGGKHLQGGVTAQGEGGGR
jgi:hypothetical protein